MPVALTGQIAHLEQIDKARAARLRHEALTAPVPWTAEYGLYQSGGWWTASLMNDTGNAADVTIRDCAARPTELLKHMPATAELLAELGLSYMWVRLARLEPNAFLWEHRDYRELRQVERHRLHLPLRTNSSAFLVTGGTKVHLASGGIWRLAPVHAHGVCNLLGPDRIHLIADVYHDAAYRRLAAKASLHRSQVEPLPAATPDVLNDRLGAARQLASLGFTDAAEWLLLRLFYRHAMPEGAVYDLIARMYEESGDSQTASRWLSTKHTVLALGPAPGSPPPNDKEKLAPGVVPELPREAPDGTQRDLPVVGMAACPGLAARLTGIFTDTAAITHLLLSGAAGAGDAVCDGADLDLIVGVADVMLPAIVAVIDDLMRVRAGALLPGWHDRRAADPDVLWFVFLLPDDGKLRQVNVGLAAASRIARICQRTAATGLLDRLPAGETPAASARAAAFIARRSGQQPSCTGVLAEHIVLAVLLHRRLSRGLALLPADSDGMTEFRELPVERIPLFEKKSDGLALELGELV